MSDFPRGGDVPATRAWLDKEGFTGIFVGWKTDALLGKSDEFVKSKFSATDNDRAEMLCGLLNTARQSAGKFTHFCGIPFNMFFLFTHVPSHKCRPPACFHSLTMLLFLNHFISPCNLFSAC